MRELLREKRLRGGQLETRFIIRNFQDETFKNASWVLVGKAQSCIAGKLQSLN